MKNTVITTGTPAREAIITGINKLNDVVKSTLGPNGMTVIIQTPNGSLQTKDGVTVASKIKLENNAENLGVELIKQVSKQAAEKAGDGTTTSTLLATEMINAGYKNVVAGANANVLKSGMEYARDCYIDILKTKYAKQISDVNSLKNVASISANNDEFIGSLISEAISAVGVNGAISVSESNTAETYSETVEGLKIDNRGYVSPFFVTDEAKKQAVLVEPRILLTMGELNFNREIEKVLTYAFNQKIPLLIIADDIKGEALETIALNKLRGNLQIAAIKAPSFGEFRMKYMEDIATITGATLLQTPVTNRSVADFDPSDLGIAGKVIINDNDTTIIEGGGSEEDIISRIDNLETELTTIDPTHEHLQEVLKERINKLSGGVVRLFIGAYTEAELQEKKDRIEDALHATRAAVKEGIVAGGGLTHINIQKDLKTVDLSDKSDDFKTGFNILVSSLDKPLQAILSNSITEDVSNIVWTLKNSDDPNFGYNALTKEFGNLIELGVIDPVRVLRVSISTAVSIAATVLTTNGVICYEKDDSKTVVNF